MFRKPHCIDDRSTQRVVRWSISSCDLISFVAYVLCDFFSFAVLLFLLTLSRLGLSSAQCSCSECSSFVMFYFIVVVHVVLFFVP